MLRTIAADKVTLNDLEQRQFILGQDHDLERVLQILKRLAEIVA